MTSGTVILALSWPRPIVAPSLGCLPATVPGDAGILYDPGAPRALPEALERIRGFDLEAAAHAGLQGVQRFDWDAIGAATLEAYRA
jgi:hypothetical protein